MRRNCLKNRDDVKISNELDRNLNFQNDDYFVESIIRYTLYLLVKFQNVPIEISLLQKYLFQDITLYLVRHIYGCVYTYGFIRSAYNAILNVQKPRDIETCHTFLTIMYYFFFVAQQMRCKEIHPNICIIYHC